MKKQSLSIYLHFPFCLRKCRYCDFLSWPASEDVRAAYVERLKEEIRFRAAQLAGSGCSYEVQTVFFGGGTPSLMSGRQLAGLMETLYQVFNIGENPEISIECNPGTVDADKLRSFRQAGVNRLSFGLQSMNDEELAYLGRIHRASDFMTSYEAARTAGFDNINIDLMSALPGQTISSWEKTLRKTADMSPEHISAYSLIIEEGTPFYDLYGNESEESLEKFNGAWHHKEILSLPDEETERVMYEMTADILDAYGYHRYEISNYAKAGRECRHNLTYWTMGDYLGLGLGASGKIGSSRLQNTDDLDEYMKDFKTTETEHLTRNNQMEEMMFLGLRLTGGVSLDRFEETFGCSARSIYGSVIDHWTKAGCLETSGAKPQNIRLTKRGLDLANQVMADFLIDEDG